LALKNPGKARHIFGILRKRAYSTGGFAAKTSSSIISLPPAATGKTGDQCSKNWDDASILDFYITGIRGKL